MGYWPARGLHETESRAISSEIGRSNFKFRLRLGVTVTWASAGLIVPQSRSSYDEYEYVPVVTTHTPCSPGLCLQNPKAARGECTLPLASVLLPKRERAFNLRLLAL
jgi:hypothetical protein